MFASVEELPNLAPGVINRSGIPGPLPDDVHVRLGPAVKRLFARDVPARWKAYPRVVGLGPIVAFGDARTPTQLIVAGAVDTEPVTQGALTSARSPKEVVASPDVVTATFEASNRTFETPVTRGWR